MRISDWSSDVCSSDLGGRKGRWQARFWAARTHLTAGSVHRISAGARNFGARRRVGWATVRSAKSGVITMKFAALLAVSAASMFAVPALAQDNRDPSQDFDGPYISIGGGPPLPGSDRGETLILDRKSVAWGKSVSVRV